MRSIAQGQQPARSELRFPNQTVWLPGCLLVSVTLCFFFLSVMWVRPSQNLKTTCPRVLITIIFFLRLTVSAVNYFGLSNRYFVLKEQVVVFCSPLFGDISLKAHMPVRAGPGSPATLSGQTWSSLVPRALWQVVTLHSPWCQLLPTVVQQKEIPFAMKHFFP